jgi:hypothetical protein
MSDIFAGLIGGIESPASNAAAITKSDTANLSPTTRAISVAAGTTLRLTLVGMADGTYVDFPVAPCVVYARRVKRVWSAGTDCTGIVGEW